MSLTKDSFDSIASKPSGYDHYVKRRSIYGPEDDTDDADSAISLGSHSSDKTSNSLVPSRFQFEPITNKKPSPSSPKKDKFNLIKKLLPGNPNPKDHLNILNKVSSTKLSKRYSPTSLELGKGISGSVFLITRKSDSKKLAAKVYKKSNNGRLSKSKFLKRVTKEIIMLAQLHHDNVISTIDIVTYKDHVTTVMEYVPINIFKLVKDKLLTFTKAMEYFSQLGAGIAYLHNECAIAHRDLKLENLGVGQDGQIKILDFGSAICLNPQSDSATIPEHVCPTCPPDSILSRRSSLHHPFESHPLSIKVQGLCGSDPYIAPEIWDSESATRHSNDHTKVCQCGYDPFKADIWSMGVLFIGMLTGKFLWPIAKPSHRDFAEFKAHRRRRLAKFDLTNHCTSIVLGMLNLRPDRRWDIDQVMAHHRQ